VSAGKLPIYCENALKWKESKVFSIDEKMHILAEVDDYVGTWVDRVAMLGLWVSTLNTIVSKWSEIEESGPQFSKERKSLMTSPLEELETIFLAWFKQAHTANSSVDELHLKEEALHLASCLGMDGFGASDGSIDCSKKMHNLVYKNISGESAIVNPETSINSKSEELPKIINRYQLKDMFNVDETGLFHNLQPSKTLTYKGDSCHGGTKLQQRVTVLLSCNAVMEKLPALVTGKYNNPHCFRNVQNFPTNYTANSSS